MRKLHDWLEAFEEYTASLSTPAVFRRWTGISILAAALERKVWVETDLGLLFPNLYIFLVSPPGVGKTVLTSMAWRAIKQLSNHHVASSSVTRATLIEEINDAERTVLVQGQTPVRFNSLYLCSNELGTLLPAYELEFMSKLTEIYDGHSYSEKRRNAKHNVAIERPQLNLFAATQPGYLASMLPEVAWEQGFLSRAILVYSGDIIRKSLFAKTEVDKSIWLSLIHDLKLIGKLHGEFRFEPKAAELVDNFYMETHKLTAPSHPKLQHYNTRRPAHLLKLVQIASASRADDLLITVDDFHSALDWLIEAESSIPNIFKAMQSGGDSQVIRDTWHFVYEQGIKSDKPITKPHLMAFLGQRVPSEKIERIIDIMTQMKLLRPEFTKAGTVFRAADDPSKVS